MSIETKYTFSVNESDEIYFQFVLYMFYIEHIEDCHVEDRKTFSDRLALCKNDLIKSHDNKQLEDPSIFEICLDNTFDKVWDSEKEFIEEYLLWVESTHTIQI